MLKAFLNTDAVRFLASCFITQYVRLTWYSGRWTHHGATANQQFWQEQKPMILALWHGRLLMMSCTWPRGLPFFMLVSKHRDGLIISRAIKALGIDSIRGSAKKPGSTKDKGGFSAIREIITTLKTGKSIG
ncbi:MAG TPA: hypothetical protein DCL54_02105, partial [Alphaproteobacteria bacterium]|nr:hypothetical protein [Alphaproteobacteria bacterium]